MAGMTNRGSESKLKFIARAKRGQILRSGGEGGAKMGGGLCDFTLRSHGRGSRRAKKGRFLRSRGEERAKVRWRECLLDEVRKFRVFAAIAGCGRAENGEYFPPVNIIAARREIFGILEGVRACDCRLFCREKLGAE